MRVGLDVTGALDPRPTGIARYVLELVRAFTAEGRDLVLLARRSRRRLSPDQVFPERDVHRWGRLGGYRLSRLDVFHGTDLRLPRRGPPTVATVHDLTALDPVESPAPSADAPDEASPDAGHAFATDRFRTRKRRLYARLSRDASMVITQTGVVARRLRDELGLDTDRITVIPLAPTLPRGSVAPPDPRRPSTSPQRPEHLLIVGGPSPRKGAHRLPRLLRFWEERLGWTPRITWVGTAHGEARDEVARALSPTDRVEFRGFVDESDLVELYTASDALLFLSTREGYGLPLLDAAITERPVLAIESASPREVLGDTAYWFREPLESSEPVFRQFLEDAAGRLERARAAHERIEGLDWSRTAERTWSVYEAAAAR